MVGTFLRRLLIAAAAVPVLMVGAQAQTTGKASSESKPLLENDRVRVIEMTFKPGDQAGGISSPNRFVYALTDGSLVFAPPGKRPYELSFNAGEALWLPSEATATINDGEKEVRALVVEFKDGGRAAAPVAKGKGRAKLKLQVRGKPAAGKPSTVKSTSKGKTRTAATD
jgi:hypothetical protein